MNAAIFPPGPEDDGTYCTNKRYPWRAFGDADYVEWVPVIMPPGVVLSDIEQTTPNGRVNFMTFPVAGEYCFKVRLCKVQ